MKSRQADLFPVCLNDMWEINISDQIFTFLLSMVLGTMLCFFYDILRATRKAGINSFVVVFFGDLIFWIISAFITYIFLLSRTNGQIRGYVLMAQMFGFILFRISISPLFVKVLSIMLGKALIFLRRVNRTTNYAFTRFDILSDRFCRFLVKKLGYWLTSAKKGLKNRGGLLYTKKDDSMSSDTKDSEHILNEF